MTRNPRRRIPRLACASLLASALAFSIAAPVAQAAPQTTASKTTASVPSSRWCDQHPRKCGRDPGRGNTVCTTTKQRVYNYRTRTWVYTYREVCTRRGW